MRMRKDYDSVGILMLSGMDEPAVAAAAICGGADGYLVKPFDIAVLRSTIDHIITSKSQRATSISNASL